MKKSNNKIIELIKTPKSKAILLYGSAIEKSNPRDFDIIHIIDEVPRHFEISKYGKITLEISNISEGELYLYLDKYYWWPHNWDFLVSNIINSVILYEQESIVSNFKTRFIEYPEKIRIFLILHRLGYLYNLSNKFQNSNNMIDKQILLHKMLDAFIILIYPIESIFPKKITVELSIYQKYENFLQRLDNLSNESIDLFFEDLVKMIIEKIDILNKKPKIFFPDEYWGLFIMSKVMKKKVLNNIKLSAY